MNNRAGHFYQATNSNSNNNMQRATTRVPNLQERRRSSPMRMHQHQLQQIDQQVAQLQHPHQYQQQLQQHQQQQVIKHMQQQLQHELEAKILKAQEEGRYLDEIDRNSDFHVNLNVCDYKPSELKVRVLDNCIVVRGIHSENRNGQSYITREFVRRYSIPSDYPSNLVRAEFSPNGILRITAQRGPDSTNENSEKQAILKDTQSRSQKRIAQAHRN